MKRTSHCLVVFIAVAAIAACWFWKQQAAATRREMARLRQQNENLASLETRLRSQLLLQPEPAAIRTRRTAKKGNSARTGGVNRLQLARTSPEEQARRLAYQRTQLRLMW